jgi:hypothetical protein
MIAAPRDEDGDRIRFRLDIFDRLKMGLAKRYDQYVTSPEKKLVQTFISAPKVLQQAKEDKRIFYS